jgi:hypothetical protein
MALHEERLPGDYGAKPNIYCEEKGKALGWVRDFGPGAVGRSNLCRDKSSWLAPEAQGAFIAWNSSALRKLASCNDAVDSEAAEFRQPPRDLPDRHVQFRFFFCPFGFALREALVSVVLPRPKSARNRGED